MVLVDHGPARYAGEGCDERARTDNRSGEAGFPKELVRLDRLVIALTDVLPSWVAKWVAMTRSRLNHLTDYAVEGSMIDKAHHIAGAADAVAVFQRHCGTGEEHAIADLICDLGHLAEELGLDFLSEVRRGIGHWYAEQHADERDVLGPDAAVEIIITPR